MFLMVAAGASFLILWLYAALGMLVLPFQESAACGLMCMFVPFYALYYLITRWDAMRGPFLSGLAAYGIVVVAAIGLPAVNAARMAAQRAAARDQPARGAQAAADDEPDDDAAGRASRRSGPKAARVWGSQAASGCRRQAQGRCFRAGRPAAGPRVPHA